MKKSYLIIGLESSCTRYVSKLIALNLNLINDESEWDGHYEISNETHIVVHRSLPHGDRYNFIDNWHTYDHIVICTRDHHCALQSKLNWHQQVKPYAEHENEVGKSIIRSIVVSEYKWVIYSYETAFLIGHSYNAHILYSLGISYNKTLKIHDINKKYFIAAESANTSHVKTVLKVIIDLLTKIYNDL